MHRYGRPMRDSEVVASIVAGDVEGVAAAYDRYADSLFKYCRFLLSDPADAADAVQDTFVIAPTRLAGLPEPDRLRAWLYAVARSECQRALRGRTTAAAPARAGTDAVDGTEAGGAAGEDGEDGDRPALRALIEDAAASLSAPEREVIELHIWHGLEAGEIAAVLGVSRPHADWLMSRARDQFEAGLGVLLAGRATPGDCADLAGMLAGWDGNLTPALRWWAHGHIKDCKTCTARRAAELSAAIPAGLAADAAVTAAALESLRDAAGPPEALKEHALALAHGQDPSAVAYRAVLVGRAGEFGRDGFPRPVRRRIAGPRRGSVKGAIRTSRRIRTAAAASVALAVVSAAVATALTGSSSAPVQLAVDGGQGSVPTTPAAPSASHAPAPAPSRSRTAPPHTRRASHSPAPRRPSATPPATAPSPAPSPTPAPPTSSAKPTPPPAVGTLTVSPAGGTLQVNAFGTGITLTAQGGPVDWSVTVSGGSGHVVMSPASGTLAPGQRVTVMIWASRHAAGRQLTVGPGGTVFTIENGFGDGNATIVPQHASLTAMLSPAWARRGVATTYRQSGRHARRGRHARPGRRWLI